MGKYKGLPVLTIEIRRDTPYRYIRWRTIENISHKYKAPAYTEWYKNGQKWYEEYRVNGVRHRDTKEGAAYTTWHDNGQKSYEEYMANGVRYRDPSEGSVVTAWYSNGQKYFEQYWVDGKT